MKNTNVITIGRQAGSSGKSIGKELAKQLNIPCYDKELLNIVSKESGVAKEYLEQIDEEKKKFNLLSSYSELNVPYFAEGYYYLDSYLSNEVLFDIQSKVIQKIVEKESCVIVGRCADYVLRENPNCVSVFICADESDRIKNLVELNDLSPEKAKKHLNRMDKRRSSYYDYHTGKNWGLATSYNLCINSSVLGVQETANTIRQFAEKKWAKG